MKRIFLMIMAAVLLGSSALADTPEPGLLRTAVSYKISTIDVALTTDDYLIPMNVFDRLFETRPGEGGSSEVVKSLVTDYSVSGDGLTYSFTLQEGVVFSNGSPLTASDVQFSFERLLKTAKQNTEIPEEVAGGTALLQGKAETLEGFHVVDDTHFTVTLEAPNAGFIAELSAPAMSVVDAETMANAPGFGMKPEDTIGSGPYIVTEWDQEHYTLVYNEKYRGPEPSVKKLIVSVIPDENTRNLKFQRGELDMLDLAGLDSLIVDATYKSNPKYRIVGTPKVGMTYLMMNENNEYLKDGLLNVEALGSKYTWFDAGNADSLYEAAGAIRTAQRSGKIVGCPEEQALKNRWITVDLLRESAQEMEKTHYGQYLYGLISDLENEEE